MIAHVFVGACLSSVDIEVNDLLIDIVALLESSNEWTNILESCASYQS